MLRIFNTSSSPVSSSKGTIGVAEGQIDSMAAQMHNSQYKMYETTVTGRDVKECISKVLVNNTQTKDTRMFVRVFVRYLNNENKYKFLRFGRYCNQNTGKITEYLQELSVEDAQVIDSSAIFTGRTTTNKYGVVYHMYFLQQK